MIDIKKEQERQEPHRTIWAIADEMRGSVDGWDFKSYILGILFYRYISENITHYINRGESDYNLSVSSYVEQEDMRKQVDIEELNARIEKIVAHEQELRRQIDDIVKEL